MLFSGVVVGSVNVKVQKFIAFLSHDRAIKRDIQRNSTTRKSQKSLIKQGKIELRRDVKIKNYTIRNQQVAGSSPASSSTKTPDFRRKIGCFCAVLACILRVSSNTG